MRAIDDLLCGGGLFALMVAESALRGVLRLFGWTPRPDEKMGED